MEIGGDKLLIDLYDKKSNFGKISVVTFNENDIEYLGNPVLTGYIMNCLQNSVENRYNCSVVLYYFYERNELRLLKLNNNIRELTVLFPYEDYDSYFDLMHELNQLISPDGFFELFVNNIYFELEAGLLIKTSENFEKIQELVRKYSLKIDYSKGLSEIVNAQEQKRYNTTMFGINFTREEVELSARAMFDFIPKSQIRAEGYGGNLFRKPKLFVSYCHQNQKEVQSIIQDLRYTGLDFWLDEEQIDIGDSIIDKVNEGISQSDIPIIFISQATKESLFASYELKTFLTNTIYTKSNGKPWFIVKLDDVNPNEIVSGLSQFKYFDYSQNKQIDNLSKAIKNKLDR